ncbi:lipoprotein NlpI [Pirellula sp. SH-Sr6A]|uniref:hypothetical protein n=1 Tax=Pirellula sp. SH-Sr6A TaxID=1632865 RepID=UPI00078DD606|nr:hypothetical protein [Pirellula sp. SH-Sr6A]AMV31221.1 lipoprotein NlpI [Pirellula sp. SH-Sr6A]
MRVQADRMADRPMLGGLVVFGAIVLGTMALTLTQAPPKYRHLAQDWSNRIEKAIQSGATNELLDELNSAIRKSPVDEQLFLARGSLYFRTGKVDLSLADFDKVIELQPESKPYLWQRGISLYYAKRYREGKEQFEVHRTVNPNDVENAFWHFLCAAKITNVENASREILLSGLDRREPLMQVQQMIAGKLPPDEVVKVTEKGGKSVQFYGYLYLGLYFDAKGDTAEATKYLRKCVAVDYPGYMYDVAKVHLRSLEQPSPTERAKSDK